MADPFFGVTLMLRRVKRVSPPACTQQATKLGEGRGRAQRLLYHLAHARYKPRAVAHLDVI